MNDPNYFEAYDNTWAPLANAVSLLDVLSRLEPTGVLDDLRRPLQLADIVDRTGLSDETLRPVLRLLELCEVVTCVNGTFTLKPGWRALTDPGAFMPLATLIAGQRVTSRALADLGQRSYWDLPSEDRLAMARSVSPDPYSDDLVATYRAQLEKDRVGRSQLQGGRLLELGCGVAGRILLTLRASPELTAVGIELSADLAAEADKRAHDLGVSDRFTVICGDATKYVADQPFDYGFWSQFFFPANTRAAALTVMLDSLKPGASFTAPVGSDPEAVNRDPEVAKDDAVLRTVLRSWGVPERSVEELRAEVEAAGFHQVEVVTREVGPAVRGWKTHPRADRP